MALDNYYQHIESFLCCLYCFASLFLFGFLCVDVNNRIQCLVRFFFQPQSRGTWYQMRGRVTSHMLVGWFPALFFVVTYAALEQSNAVTIGYGGNTGCWITNRVANVCIFTAPVALSLLFVYFIRAIEAIRQTGVKREISQNGRKREATYKYLSESQLSRGFLGYLDF